MKCPGQDSRYWGADAVCETLCPACDAPVEFFKDESKGRCPSCGFRFHNPSLDLGCAEWCPHAEACIGTVDKSDGPGGSVVEQLIALGKSLPGVPDNERQRGLRALVQAQNLLLEEPGTPRVVLAAALFRGLGEAAPSADTLLEAGLDRVSVSLVADLLAAMGKPGDLHKGEALPDGDARLVADAVALAGLAGRLREGAPSEGPEEPWHTGAAARLARQILAQ